MVLRAEPARSHDLAGGLDLLRRCELAQQDVAERWGHYFVVREDDGRVVAVAGLEVHGASALLRGVAVDPDYRGQGLAAALVEAAIARAKLLELRDVYLLTTTAHDYFLRHGFSEHPREAAPASIRECWEFRSGCPTTAALMRRPVT
jgi:amino-acid N-acetyltransferase